MRFQSYSIENKNATVNIIHYEEMSNETTANVLFIRTVPLKPKSNVSHYYMSELVVKLKFKFTTWITVQYPAILHF
jgi:hypothetical protein